MKMSFYCWVIFYFQFKLFLFINRNYHINGRNIYKNIKKAISYIIAIHIPIALLSLFVPMFKLPTLLLPIHVMLLELLIDPTSSIIFQRIKPSKDIMKEQPRNIKESIINLKLVPKRKKFPPLKKI